MNIAEKVDFLISLSQSGLQRFLEKISGFDHRSKCSACIAFKLNVVYCSIAPQTPYRKALSIFEEKLGPNHPDTQSIQNDLASLP